MTGGHARRSGRIRGASRVMPGGRRRHGVQADRAVSPWGAREAARGDPARGGASEGEGSAMVVHHGRHRRRSRAARLALISAAVVVLLAGVVAAVLYWGRGDGGASTAGGRSGTPPHTTASAASSTAPRPSSPTPTAEAAIPVGGTPHCVKIAPDGSFAYVADSAAG